MIQDGVAALAALIAAQSESDGYHLTEASAEQSRAFPCNHDPRQIRDIMAGGRSANLILGLAAKIVPTGLETDPQPQS